MLYVIVPDCCIFITITRHLPENQAMVQQPGPFRFHEGITQGFETRRQQKEEARGCTGLLFLRLVLYPSAHHPHSLATTEDVRHLRRRR